MNGNGNQRRIVAVIYEDGEPQILEPTYSGIVRRGAEMLVRTIDGIQIGPQVEKGPDSAPAVGDEA